MVSIEWTLYNRKWDNWKNRTQRLLKTFVFRKTKSALLWVRNFDKIPVTTHRWFHQKKCTLKHSNQVVLEPFVELTRCDKIFHAQHFKWSFLGKCGWLAGFHKSKIIIISSRNSPVTPAHCLFSKLKNKLIDTNKNLFNLFSVGRRDYNHLTYSKLSLKFCFL